MRAYPAGHSFTVLNVAQKKKIQLRAKRDHFGASYVFVTCYRHPRPPRQRTVETHTKKLLLLRNLTKNIIRYTKKVYGALRKNTLYV